MHPRWAQVEPTKGNVAFASPLYGWSFTLESFATLYCEVRRAALRCAALRWAASVGCSASSACHATRHRTRPAVPFPSPARHVQVQGAAFDPREFAQRLWGDRYFNPGALCAGRMAWLGARCVALGPV